MSAFFQSGRIADLILLILVIEAAALIILDRRQRLRSGDARGSVRFMGAPRMDMIAVLANVAAGGCLVLALRAALRQSSWAWIAGFLAAALIAHIVDMVQRRR